MDNPKITSNLNNITFNDFKTNSEIELVVKISNIWINKKTKLYGLSCHLSQVKYNGLPEQGNIDFIDENIKNFIPPPPIMNINPIDIFNKSVASSGNKVIPSVNKVVPSINDLKNALQKLKKI